MRKTCRTDHASAGVRGAGVQMAKWRSWEEDMDEEERRAIEMAPFWMRHAARDGLMAKRIESSALLAEPDNPNALKTLELLANVQRRIEMIDQVTAREHARRVSMPKA